MCDADVIVTTIIWNNDKDTTLEPQTLIAAKLDCLQVVLHLFVCTVHILTGCIRFLFSAYILCWQVVLQFALSVYCLINLLSQIILYLFSFSV